METIVQQKQTGAVFNVQRSVKNDMTESDGLLTLLYSVSQIASGSRRFYLKRFIYE